MFLHTRFFILFCCQSLVSPVACLIVLDHFDQVYILIFDRVHILGILKWPNANKNKKTKKLEFNIFSLNNKIKYDGIYVIN